MGKVSDGGDALAIKAEVDSMGMQAPKKEAAIRLVLPLITLVSIMLIIVIGRIMPDWQWVNEPLHTTLGSFEFLAAVSLAVLLLISRRNDRGVIFGVWVPAGLLVMGILKGFSSSLPEGNSSMWLHGLAMLCGGLFFAVGFLPIRAVQHATRNIPTAFGVASAMIMGIISLFISGILPEMLNGISYTATAIVINTIGGFLFAIAASLFFFRYIATEKTEDMLFACFAALNGASQLSFPFGQTWQGEWWLWHIFRLTGAVSLLAYTYAMFKQSEDFSWTAEQNYRAILETSMDGFFIVDTKGNFVEANETYCRLIGYDFGELIHMAIPDIEADERPEEVANHLRKVMQTGGDRSETSPSC